MMEHFKKSMPIDYEKSENGLIVVKATSEVLDYHGDIVKAEGYNIDHLMKSKKLANLEHMKHIEVGEIVGAELVKGDTPYVTNTIKLHENKKGEAVREMLNDGTIGSVSIEFKAYEKDMISDGKRRIINKSYPTGIAFCQKPANPQALVMQKAEPSDVIETLRYYQKSMNAESFMSIFPLANEILWLASELNYLKDKLGVVLGDNDQEQAIDIDSLAANIAARLKLKL